jgi:hypothetical protein
MYQELVSRAVVAFSGTFMRSRQRRREEEVIFMDLEGGMQVPGALPFGLDSLMPGFVAHLWKEKGYESFCECSEFKTAILESGLGG